MIYLIYQFHTRDKMQSTPARPFAQHWHRAHNGMHRCACLFMIAPARGFNHNSINNISTTLFKLWLNSSRQKKTHESIFLLWLVERGKIRFIKDDAEMMMIMMVIVVAIVVRRKTRGVRIDPHGMQFMAAWLPLLSVFSLALCVCVSCRFFFIGFNCSLEICWNEVSIRTDTSAHTQQKPGAPSLLLFPGKAFASERVCVFFILGFFRCSFHPSH